MVFGSAIRSLRFTSFPAVVFQQNIHNEKHKKHEKVNHNTFFVLFVFFVVNILFFRSRIGFLTFTYTCYKRHNHQNRFTTFGKSNKVYFLAPGVLIISVKQDMIKDVCV